MKKTFFWAVFFISAVLLFSGCKSGKEKVKPDMVIENNTRNSIVTEQKDTKDAKDVKTPENKAPETIDIDVRQGTRETEKAKEEPVKNIVTPPQVEIRESYLKNKNKKWVAVYDTGEILDALNKLEMSVATVGNIEVAQINDNDCATTISVGGRFLSAYDFKEAIGLKSTMITEIKRGDGEYTFTGFGEN